MKHFLSISDRDFERLRELDRKEAAETATSVLSLYSTENPDEYASDKKLGSQFGIDAPAVKYVRPELQQKQQMLRHMQSLDTAPKLALWLSDRSDEERAILAHDDIDNLSGFEFLARYFKEYGKSAGYNVQSGFYGKKGSFLAQTADDMNRSFSEIKDDTESEYINARGEVKKYKDIGSAAFRWSVSRGSNLSEEELRQGAREAYLAAGEMLKKSAGIERTKRVRDLLEIYEKGTPAEFIKALASDLIGAAQLLGGVAIESSPGLAAGIATAAVTRNAGASSSVAGAFGMGLSSYLMESGNALVSYYGEKGIDITTPEGVEAVLNDPQLRKEAEEKGFTRGLAVALFDAVSGGMAGKVLAKGVVRNMIAQSAVQAGAGATGELAGQIASGENINWNAAILEAMAEFTTAPVEVAGLASERFINHTRRQQAGENTKSALENLSANAQTSKLRSRDPAKFQEAIEAAGIDGSLFIPADKFTEYFQSNNIDINDFLLEFPGIDIESIRSAQESGGDIQIPVSSYTAYIAGTDFDAFFQENSRLNPDEMTYAEAQEFNAKAEEAIDEAYREALEEIAQDNESRSEEQVIYDTMFSRLREAGRGYDIARQEAQPFVAFYRVVAEKTGNAIEDLTRIIPLPEIRSDLPQGIQYKDVDALTFTLAELRSRGKRRKSEKQIRGASLLDFLSDVGIKGDRGDIRVILDGKEKKGRKKILREDGLGIDEAARAAIEAGYLSDFSIVNEYKTAVAEGREVPDISIPLLEAIEEETRGRAHYRQDDAAEAEARHQQELDQMEEYLAKNNISLDQSDTDIRAALEQSAATTYDQAARGSVMFPSDGNGAAVINLFQSADLSTLLHESGHFFLNAYKTLAANDTTGTLSKDLDVIKKWWADNAEAVAKDGQKATGSAIAKEDVTAYLEGGTTGDHGKDRAIDIGTQEQWARAFETYLMEGKAPSVELRPAFERFRAWLLEVYRKARGLNVNVTDDIRAVFDRMLATDAEIQEAKADTGLSAISKEAASVLGLSEKEQTKLSRMKEEADAESEARLLRDTMEPLSRQRKQWYIEERASVQKDVEERINAMPVYRAREAMGNQRFLGEEKTEIPDIRISRQVLVEQYGEGVLKTLPRGRRVIYAENGIDPDIAADFFGFQSGSAMIDALVKSPRRKDAIRQETNKIMYDRHGDVLHDGSIEEKTLSAIHSDKQGALFTEELKAFKNLSGDSSVSLSWQQIRSGARETISGMKVRDALRADKFLAAERRAGKNVEMLLAKSAKEAGKALSSEDTRAAGKSGDLLQQLIQEKQKQLINHALYNEALKVGKEVSSIIDKSSNLNRSDEKLSKSRDIDYVKAARSILSRFNLAKADDDFSVSSWLEQLEMNDPDALSQLSDAMEMFQQNPANYKELTVSDLRTIRDVAFGLVHQASTINKIEVEGRQIDADTARTELFEQAADIHKENKVGLEKAISRREKIRSQFLPLKATLLKVESWARTMDAGKAGPYTRYIVRPVMDAVNIYRDAKKEVLSSFLEIIEPRRKDLLGRPIASPELNYEFENKGALIHAILHTGNESNKKKLFLGRKWGQLDENKKVISPQWDSMIDRMIAEGVLTKEDFDMCQAIWDLNEDIKTLAQATHRKIKSYYFKEIKPTSLVTPFGVYKGGYVPAIADGAISIDGNRRAGQAALSDQQVSSIFPTTGSGFTKSRSENYATPLQLNLRLLPSHIDQVLRYTHLQPAISQSGRLVNSRDFREFMNGIDPSVIDNAIIPWLQRTARQTVETPSTTEAGRNMDNFFRKVRKRAGLSLMFGNVVNTAQQITGLSSAAVLVKPSYIGDSFINFLKSPVRLREEIQQSSSFMRNRVSNGVMDVSRRIEEIIIKPTALGEIEAWGDKHGYFMQAGAQNMVDLVVWDAAYNQSVAKGMPHKDAVFEADSVVRRTQGGFGAEEISAFESGSAFKRLFTMFYSYFNTQGNLLASEYYSTLRTLGWNGGKSHLLYLYLFGLAIPAIVAEGIAQGLRGDFDDEEEGADAKMLELFFESQFKFLSATVPIMGTMANRVYGSFTSEIYDDKLSMSPAASLIENALGIGGRLKNIGNEDKEINKQAAIRESFAAISLLTGVPLNVFAKPINYKLKIDEGKADPNTAFDILQGALTGRDGTEE